MLLTLGSQADRIIAAIRGDDLAHDPRVTSLDLDTTQSVEAAVRQYHQLMNALTGWDAVTIFYDEESQNWDFLSRRLDEGGLIDHIETMADQAALDSLAQDLRTFATSLETAVEKRDPNELRFAHRIVHDLDYFYYGHQTVEGGTRLPFGVTATVGDEPDGS